MRGIIARSRVLSRLTKSWRGQHLISVARHCSLVRERRRFVGNELFRPPGFRAAYRLRNSDVHIVLRVRTGDAGVLREIIALGAYEPPDAVARILTSIPTPVRVLDLGGNVGIFGAFVLDRFKCPAIISVEPDPENALVLAACIAANAPANWTSIQACAGVADGRVAFAAYGSAHSKVVGDEVHEAVVLPMIDVFAMASNVHYVKIDIEGSEWPILADPRLAQWSAMVIVLEWHAHESQPGDPREAAIEALSAAGYETAAEPAGDHPHGVVWGWRSAPS